MKEDNLITYSLTQADYLQANYTNARINLFNKSTLKIYGFLFILLFIVFCYNDRDIFEIFTIENIIVENILESAVASLSVVILTYLFCLFISFVFLPAQSEKFYIQDKRIGDHTTLVIHDKKLEFITETSHHHLNYDILHKWTETTNQLILYTNDILMHIIPKRCLTHENYKIIINDLNETTDLRKINDPCYR